MNTQVNKQRKNVLKLGSPLLSRTAAGLLILAVLAAYAGCSHTVSPKSGNSKSSEPAPDAGKTYNVGEVRFIMKEIAAVKDGTIGHSSQSDNPVRTITLDAYRIGETEVTQQLWKKVMNNNPSTYSDNPANGERQETRPVENVSWYDCIVFCNELTKLAGLGESECVYYTDAAFSTVYTAGHTGTKPHAKWEAKGFRLPTEKEWEWAAKGGTNDQWAGTDDGAQLKHYAWYKTSDGGDAENKTHEVKKKRANGYGLYDMSGNVWEWCWDAATNGKRYYRGGGWINDKSQITRFLRIYTDDTGKNSRIGLRLVNR